MAETNLIFFRPMLTEKEFEQVKFSLEHLHDADLSNYGADNIKALESAMKKFGIKFESQLDEETSISKKNDTENKIESKVAVTNEEMPDSEVAEKNEFEKQYGYCQFRDAEGYCYFDKSEEDIENGNIDLCDNIYAKRKTCRIY